MEQITQKIKNHLGCMETSQDIQRWTEGLGESYRESLQMWEKVSLALHISQMVEVRQGDT